MTRALVWLFFFLVPFFRHVTLKQFVGTIKYRITEQLFLRQLFLGVHNWLFLTSIASIRWKQGKIGVRERGSRGKMLLLHRPSFKLADNMQSTCWVARDNTHYSTFLWSWINSEISFSRQLIMRNEPALYNGISCSPFAKILTELYWLVNYIGRRSEQK